MTGTEPTTRIAELPVRWLRDHMHEALTIYGLAMGYDAAVVAGRYGYAIQHTDRPGFRAVGAFETTRTASSSSASATATWSSPGSGGTTRSAPRWTGGRRRSGCPAPSRSASCTSTPTTRARAWAGGCCTPCVAGLPHPAALLSTPDADTKAFRLYHADGFVDLARGYHFPGDARPFAILGARLPAASREPGPANS